MAEYDDYVLGLSDDEKTELLFAVLEIAMFLGRDADVAFWVGQEADGIEDEVIEGFYCPHSGEPLISKKGSR